MKDQSGFTFIEVVVVIVIIGTIMTIATLNFKRMNEKQLAESNVKEIYSLLMKARNDASKTSTQHLVVLAANKVRTGADANNDNNIDGNAANYTCKRFSLNYNSNFSFNKRGLASKNQTISLAGLSADTNPVIDCIAISATRINYGKMSGGACVQR